MVAGLSRVSARIPTNARVGVSNPRRTDAGPDPGPAATAADRSGPPTDETQRPAEPDGQPTRDHRAAERRDTGVDPVGGGHPERGGRTDPERGPGGEPEDEHGDRADRDGHAVASDQTGERRSRPTPWRDAARREPLSTRGGGHGDRTQLFRVRLTHRAIFRARLRRRHGLSTEQHALSRPAIDQGSLPRPVADRRTPGTSTPAEAVELNRRRQAGPGVMRLRSQLDSAGTTTINRGRPTGRVAARQR